MDPGPVVDDLDVLEQVQRGLLARGAGARVHAFRLRDAHERFRGRVVPRRRDRPHRRPDAAPSHGLGQEQRRVLRAVIAVMDASLWRVSPGQRHFQRLVGQLGGDVGAHRPARYAPRPYVHHERQIQPALAGLDVGDVREPRRVGAAGLEPALDQVVRGLPLGSALLARGPLGARARDAAPSALAHYARHALPRRANPHARQREERLRRAVDAPNLIPDLGYRDGKLLVAHGVRARRARPPGVIALARHLQRRAHLRHRPIGLVGEYELELRPLRGKAYSCLLAKKALAFKSISFSRLGRSFSLFSLRRSSAIWNGLASGAGPAASAFLTQSARLPASQPSPRATSAYVAPDFLYSSTAFCLDSAVYLGDGLPMARLAFLRCGHHAETEIDLSTDLGQIQIHVVLDEQFDGHQLLFSRVHLLPPNRDGLGQVFASIPRPLRQRLWCG